MFSARTAGVKGGMAVRIEMSSDREDVVMGTDQRLEARRKSFDPAGMWIDSAVKVGRWSLRAWRR